MMLHLIHIKAVEFYKVVTNVGNNYDSRDGQFTAPIYGLYMVSATICNLVGFLLVLWYPPPINLTATI